ncbi:type I secretion system permease/ATPase [Roseicyclus sp.]|uniref:type I secretion system permease/ATPase n=1 Tax=Roseicyclus sp. TaxID=1914329 RepID=UPI001BCC3AE3|nr:type I secretion system permease/ATPase [Roseicyclus sp.]
MSRTNRAGPDELTVFRRRNAWLLWSVGLFSMAVNALMLTGPLYMLQVYDRVLGSRSAETLLALSVLILFLFAMMAVLDFARGRVAARYGARLQDALDTRIFAAALTRAQRTGEGQTALQDLAAVQRLAASPVFMALFDLPWTPLFIAAILLFHPWLGALAVVGMALLIVLALVNRARSHGPIADAAMAAQSADRVGAEMQGEAELIRALGMQGNAFARWHRQRRIALAEGMRASDLVGGFSATTRSLRLLMQSAILGLGAYLVLQAEMTAGAMIAGSILLGRALAPIDMVIGQWNAIAEAGQSWQRLRALLRDEVAAAPRMPLPQPKARIEVSQLSVIPPGAQVPTLRGVSFAIAPGEAVGIIGPSGAGKSTLARAMTAVWQPAVGQIRLDGATLDQYDPDALGHYIGYLPQSVTLFAGTIAENIARLSATPDTQKVVAAARMAGAHEMILALPDGYETLVSGLGARLSGGQIQRIGLARALYGAPVLVVLDEPNAALDNDGSLALNNAVQAIKADGRAVLIMAHRPSAIRECDKLLVLSGGTTVMFGPTQEVLQKTLVNYADIKATAVGGVT